MYIFLFNIMRMRIRSLPLRSKIDELFRCSRKIFTFSPFYFFLLEIFFHSCHEFRSAFTLFLWSLSHYGHTSSRENKWTATQSSDWRSLVNFIYQIAAFNWKMNVLTVFAFAFLDQRFVLDVVVTGLAEEPSAANKNTFTCKRSVPSSAESAVYRFTSSALWAMKKPCVFAWILAPRGFIEILLSTPSSVPFISIANRSSFNFVKHNLKVECGY